MLRGLASEPPGDVPVPAVFDRFRSVPFRRRRLVVAGGGRGPRRWPWVVAALVLLVIVVGAIRGPATVPLASPAVAVADSVSRLVAADGVVVDCAGVNGRGPGLPGHAELTTRAAGGRSWAFGPRAGRFEVWWITRTGQLVAAGGVHVGPVTLLAPSSAAYGVAVPGMEVPESAGASWQVGPACKSAG
jgi:hypothetical protein